MSIDIKGLLTITMAAKATEETLATKATEETKAIEGTKATVLV